MARRAKFGRRPQSQPNVAGTLIAIAREMQAKRDSNIMDAWKNGGEFEGKPVTDEMVQAYWKKRQQGLDKKDPSYDAIQDQIMQLQYGIEQSKMDLKHVQGKISDTEYADFFLHWANKVPKNGEFYRVLQKDAAQLMEAAKERARIDGERAKQESFNKYVEAKNRDIGVGSAITDSINRLSQETGLSITGNGDRLLELLSEDYREHPDRYHALTDSLSSAGISGFDGEFTHAFVAGQVNNAQEAYDDIAVRARKDGYASAYDSAVKGQAQMSSWGTNMEVWSVAKGYDAAWSAFSKVWNDPSASYRDKQQAATMFSESTAQLAKTPNIDNATQQMLQADSMRALGQDAGDTPSFGMAQLGRQQGITPDMQQQVLVTQSAQLAMDQNPGVYTYAPMNPDGTFDPTGQAPVGIVAVSAVPADAVLVAQPGLGGVASMVAIAPHTVYVNDPNNPDAAPIAVGKTIDYRVGGQTITMYGYQDGQGNAQWTLRSPYADGVTASKDKNGNLMLSLPGQGSPASVAQALDTKYGTNISQQIAAMGSTPGSKTQAVTYQRDADGKVTAKLTIDFDGTGFSVKQTQLTLDGTGKQVEGATTSVPVPINQPTDLAAAALAPSRVSGQNIPGTYSSPLMTSVAATAQTMSTGQVAALAQDPAFQHAFLTQTMQNYGTNNPLDPRIAAAWNSVTAKANGAHSPMFEASHHRGPGATERGDLDYPGATIQDPTKTTATVSFGGQDIKVPGLPGYLAGAAGAGPSVNLNPISDMLGGQSTFGSSVLQMGQPVGMPTQAGPATGKANGYTVTPTAMPKPLTAAAPAPIATTAPIAMPKQSSAPTKPGQPRAV